jgi:DNA-binding response OmpR family regulator
MEKVFAFEQGADDYVTKPFGTKELRARIKALLRRAEEPSRGEPAVFTFGDVEVDMARGEVRCAGRPLDVTLTEFKLLTAFVRNRGRVMMARPSSESTKSTNSPANPKSADSSSTAIGYAATTLNSSGM